MIKNLTTLAAFGLLAACTATKGDTGDTGDTTDTTDTDTDVEVAWDLVDFSGDCASGVCIYSMTTSREAGTLEIWITETADTTSTEPWSETHDAFTLVSTNDDGSEVYEIRLDWVTDYTQQVDNASTLLNEDVLGATWADRLTWSFEATSPSGEFDCAVTGQDTAYFADRCTNVE